MNTSYYSNSGGGADVRGYGRDVRESRARAAAFPAEARELAANSEFVGDDFYTLRDDAGRVVQWAVDVRRIGGVGQVIEAATVVCELHADGDWCWQKWLALNDPLKGWALNTLAMHVVDGDYAPDALRVRAAMAGAAREGG